MRQSDRVWNRACAEAGGSRTLTAPGDRALADMLLLHGLAMNGGVLHAIETRNTDERAAAVSGYRYFGLDAAADVVEEIARRWGTGDLDTDDVESLELEADERYCAAISDDCVLVSAFEARFESEPSAFDAVD